MIYPVDSATHPTNNWGQVSVALWLGRLPCDPEIQGSRPVLTAGLIGSWWALVSLALKKVLWVVVNKVCVHVCRIIQYSSDPLWCMKVILDKKTW